MSQSARIEAIVPYSSIGKVLLECIYDALKLMIINEKNKLLKNSSREFKSSDEDLRNSFKPFFTHKDNQRGINPHFLIGHTSKENYEARVTKIILQKYQDIQVEAKSIKGVCIPSPLAILFQILIVPDEPQSSAYSLMFCRTYLFEYFKVFPEHPLIPNNYTSFNISDINDYLDNFNSYTKQSNNIPQTETVNAQMMLAHFLAMKNVFYFRFGKTGKLLSDRRNLKEQDTIAEKLEQIEVVIDYLSQKKLSGSLEKKKTFEFHKLSYFEELPESAALINELSGIPIPIRGGEIIFQGGIKTDSNSNLVVRISGEPGSGKTSMALALCASLSPQNTFSYYMSLEENPQDLKNRLYSLIPSYLKKLSIFDSNVDNWFWADKIPLGLKNRLDYFEAEYIDKISEKLSKKKDKANLQTLPSICPLIIVIDSIRVLLNEKDSDLEKFIEKCKKLNALIILISANDERFHHEIDYLVDLVIHLKHAGTETEREKPIRILQLSKTRHQISRPGSHVFHLSGESGFRISPQLPSQIDKKEKIQKPTPSTQYYIDFFNNSIGGKIDKKTKSRLEIWDTSQILIHGYGSSGKAGLSLSILLSQIRSKDHKDILDYSHEKYRRKVLVISLLYPEHYYIDLKKKISNKTGYSKLECIYFYSGFLTPEDFIGRVLRKLDEAILQGEPFTGILLDGLHNVSLQFHKLQDSDTVWPTLYSLLAKYRLTIITTFTNFIIDNEGKKGSMDDDEILLKGHKPLLHALVQATDYHFVVQPPNLEFEKIHEGKYIVSLKSAIRHKLRGEKFVWDREKIVLCDYNQ